MATLESLASELVRLKSHLDEQLRLWNVWSSGQEVKVMTIQSKMEMVEGVLRDRVAGGKGKGSGMVKYQKAKQPDRFYPGKEAEAEFESWAFVLMEHLNDQLPGLEKVLEAAARKEDVVSEEWVEQKSREAGFGGKAAEELVYRELRALMPKGEPQTIIRNNKEDRRGVEVWRRICRRYQPQGEMVAQKISEQLMSIEWPKGPAGVFEMLERIDRLCKDFEALVGDQYPERSIKTGDGGNA